MIGQEEHKRMLEDNQLVLKNSYNRYLFNCKCLGESITSEYRPFTYEEWLAHFQPKGPESADEQPNLERL